MCSDLHVWMEYTQSGVPVAVCKRSGCGWAFASRDDWLLRQQIREHESTSPCYDEYRQKYPGQYAHLEGGA
jgi:hypothetical protein